MAEASESIPSREPEPPLKKEEAIVEFDEPAPDLEWEDWDGEEEPSLPVELGEEKE